ncbi:Small molecule metabolism [plant metagenome]|uniref:Small molecule metabolism n=1 Tax=plant metagenome TaxID=1297885 RepID=A0A484R6Q7_9ZZZZ
MTFRNGLDSLLRPEDSVLVLIDHQPYQLATQITEVFRSPPGGHPAHDRGGRHGGSDIAFLWEHQLLNTSVPAKSR